MDAAAITKNRENMRMCSCETGPVEFIVFVLAVQVDHISKCRFTVWFQCHDLRIRRCSVRGLDNFGPFRCVSRLQSQHTSVTLKLHEPQHDTRLQIGREQGVNTFCRALSKALFRFRGSLASILGRSERFIPARSHVITN